MDKWFGSYFYNVLYSHRNSDEAKKFVEKFLEIVTLPSDSEIWDMACGNGRHAIVFAKKNFFVTASDSSILFIDDAKKNNYHPNVNYQLHDYTFPIDFNRFDLVLNLFTSLGYNNQPDELNLIFSSAFKSLKINGLFLIDFLNPNHVKKNFVPFEKITKKDLIFYITRSILTDPPAVAKKIEVVVNTERRIFNEWVRLYETADFLTSAKDKFELIYQWGNYDLKNWNIDSPRNILLFKKIKN